MDILVVEDDLKVGSFLKENLSRDNSSITLIREYNELRSFIENPSFTPALFILDRLLGNDDTKKLLQNLKKRFPNSMVLFLSAINTPQEKATLLDEGADDYLGKPFSLVELQARVRSLLRRSKEDNTSSSFFLHVGDTIIDMKSRHVICNGTKIDLTHKEFLLMLNFCENRNRVFSKYQLLDLIWETNLDVESNVIEVNIMNLRKKIEACDSTLKILSKRNVGYWLEA